MKKLVKKFICYMLTNVMVGIMIYSLTPAIKANAADEFDSMREKWKMMLIGGTSYDTSDPNIAAQIAKITAAAQSAQSTMDKTGTQTYIWRDCNNGSVSAQITTAYGRMRDMALAYNTYGSTLYHDEALLNNVIYALDWYNTKKYYSGASSYQNWWDWQIGIPLALNDITILLYDKLTPTQITNYMNAVDYFQPTATLTGANRAWECEIIGVRGVIVKDGTKVSAARDGVSDLFKYVDNRDGFYTDGSFVQHNYYAYNGGYGRSIISDLSNLLYLLNGSSYEVTDVNVENVFKWVYDSYEMFVYKGAMMDMVRGREISREYNQDHAASHQVMASIIHLSEIAESTDAAAYKSMIKYWLETDTYNNFLTDTSIEMILKGTDILNDSSVSSRGELIKYKQFANNDRAVQLRPGYGFGISMHSSRIYNYESINSENAKGWHTGDGMTYLYNNDLSQFSDDFWPTVNAYRLPGTTVLQNTSNTACIGSDKDWVGGTDIDGLYGVTGMELHPSEKTLTAKKSWFMFDDEIVALGTGITSTDGIPVESIIENRKLNSTGDNELTVNGTAKSTNLGWTENMTGVKSIHLAGKVTGSDIGYYFPEATKIKGIREARTGIWKDINSNDTTSTTSTTPRTRNFLNLWFDHGTNPTNDTYSYVILPNKTREETNSYASNPDVTILENSPDAQAVKEKNLNIVGVNFWNNISKTVDIITSDRKSSVMTKETESDIEVSVSDPTMNGKDTIDVEINKSATGIISVDSGVVVTQLSPTIKMSVSTIGAKGKAFKAKFATTGTGTILQPITVVSPIIIEAEGLAAVNFTDSYATGNNKNASGGKYSQFKANAINDYIDYKVNVPKAGTYDVKIRAMKNTSGGTYQLTVGDGNPSVSFDAYIPIDNYQDFDLGNFTFNGPGDRIFRLTCIGKNTSSSGYQIGTDYISLSAVNSTVAVTSVGSISDVNVDNGTDKNDIGLPEYIDVTLDNSTTTSAAVTWDDGNPVYDGNTEGRYTFAGTLDLPDGITNSNNLQGRVNVIVGNHNNPTAPSAVTSVDSISDINVDNGTDKNDIGLPEYIDVTLDNSTTTSAAVTWDDGNPVYDGNTEGRYTFAGTLDLPDGITNSNNLQGRVNVIVGNYNNPTVPSAVTSVDSISDINVDNGTDKNDIGLPEYIDVTLDNSTTTSAAVTWDDGSPVYDGNTEGRYTFAGTLDLPDGITNPNNLQGRVNVIVEPTASPAIIPVAVKIRGVQKAGNILSAELIDRNESVFTTSESVTYNWYRLDNSNSEFVNVIGTGRTYTLTSSDLGKYIGLRATYEGKTFSDKTAMIKAAEVVIPNPAHSTNNSSSYSSDDKTATVTNNNTTTPEEGWKENLNYWKYIKNGQPVTGWNQINGTWYLMDSTGTMQIGWRQTNGVWYLLNNDGTMATGWQQSNGEWYFLNTSGAMETGWKISNNNWYFLKDDGSMAKGWVQSNGIWYLLKDDGSMAIGWQQSNGQWYYLYRDGAMASNTNIDGYTLGKDGALIQ